jgi:hypothetical protein
MPINKGYIEKVTVLTSRSNIKKLPSFWKINDAP